MWNRLSFQQKRAVISFGFFAVICAAFYLLLRPSGKNKIIVESSHAETVMETLPEAPAISVKATAAAETDGTTAAAAADAVLTGWIKNHDGWRYYDEYHEMLSDMMIDDNGNTYYLDNYGLLITNGWFQYRKNWYCADSEGRILKSMRTPDGYLVDQDGKFFWVGTESGGTIIVNNNYVGSSGTVYSGSLRLNTGTADLIWAYLKQHGWTDTAAAGVLGNFQQESGLSPSLEEESTHHGYGLGQWSYERRTGLENYAASRGLPVSDLYMQLDYLLTEPGEKAYVDRYSHTEFASAAAAAYDWGTQWERFNYADGSMDNVRIPYAEAYYRHYVYGT